MNSSDFGRADVADITGVKVGDVYAFNETYTGVQSQHGNFIRTYNITEVVNVSGDARIQCFETIDNKTSGEKWNTTFYEYADGSLTATRGFEYFINKNIANKSYSSAVYYPYTIQNGTWDENGVLNEYHVWRYDTWGVQTMDIIRITQNTQLGSGNGSGDGSGSNDQSIPGYRLEIIGLISMISLIWITKKHQNKKTHFQ